MVDDNLTSGFIGTVRQEEEMLHGLKELYRSVSGYNRLFCWERYGRLHVIKVLKEEYIGSQFYEQALYKEFSIGYQLEHPHICRTLGWEKFPQLGHGIILEYIDGVMLKDMLEQHRVTSEWAYKWIAELCEALQYLHSKQIVHRDLKPSNVLITHNGYNCKLIDFSLSDCDDYDVLKLPAGTRYYMAPEVLQGNESLDLRADIYSLGVIIGELSTCLKDKHLASISRKCTQRIKEKRYASAGLVLKALESKPNKRLHKIIGATVLVVLSAVLIGIWAFQQPSRHMNASSFPAFGNCSVSEHCRAILTSEQQRMSEELSDSDIEADSIRLLNRLKTALDEDFPLAVQRNSAVYQNHWQALKKEADALISLRREH